MARKRIIAGNWKMNKTPSEAVALVNELKDLVKNDAVDVVYWLSFLRNKTCHVNLFVLQELIINQFL